jgi:hypothetical protein
MDLREAKELLENSGYLCEFTVAATPTFDEYKDKVIDLIAQKTDIDRATRIVDYLESNLKDAYNGSMSIEQGADIIIDLATPSDKQREVLEFMYNNWDADTERSYGPAAEYKILTKQTRQHFDDDLTGLIPYDMEEFAVLYGKDINE